jgi:hypothetical protein
VNALANFPRLDIEGLTQTELFALCDQLHAVIQSEGIAYATSGPTHVRHRSSRRLYRHEAAETLAFHHLTLAEAKASPRLITATRRIAADLERAMRESFPEEA